MNVKASEATLLLIDFETTGVVEGWPNEAWQVGYAIFQNGKIDPYSFNERLIRVGDRPFSPYAPGRHHQLRNELRAAPTWHELWSQFSDLLERVDGCVAHNASTERTILTKAAPLQRPLIWIDTLVLIRKAYPSLKSYALSDAVFALGLQARLDHFLPDGTYHEALYDAAASGVLLEKLLMADEWGRLTLEDLASLSGRRTKS